MATRSEQVDVLVPRDGRPVRAGLLTLSSTGGDLRMTTADYRQGYTRIVVEVEREADAWRVTGTVEQVEALELHSALHRPEVADDSYEDDEQPGQDPDEQDGDV